MNDTTTVASTSAPALGMPPRANHVSGYDLLRVRPVRALVRWGGFPYVFQALLLAVFVTLIALGWGVFAPAGVPSKVFAKANLVTLTIWGVWWTGMVWIAVLFGRVWCAVCPLELVANVSERVGRAAGIRQRVLGRWMASGALIVALYAALQLAVATVQLHRTPAYTAWFLLGLLLLAAVTGLLLKDRAFCRGFCPVGLLLGTYARGAMLAVRAAGPEPCAACTTRDCLVQRNRARLDQRSCPGLLHPPTLDTNRDCLICGQCFKACPHDNLQLRLRWPFAGADARETADWPVTAFVMVLSGFVTWELFTEWKAGEAVFMAAPRWLAGEMGVAGAIAGAVNWLWALVIVPAAVWLTLAGLMKIFGEPGDFGYRLRRLALPLAVLVAAGHMSKGLAKFTSWSPFLPTALDDPGGVATAQAITAKALATPPPLVPLSTVSWVGLALIACAVVFSIREYRKAPGGSRPRSAAALPLVAVAAAYAGIVAQWR